MRAGPKSSDKEAKTSNIIGAVAVAMALLLALAIAIPTKAADTLTEVRIVKAGPYQTIPTINGAAVDWEWEDPLGRTIKAQRIYAAGNYAIYMDRWTLDGVAKTSIQYLFTKSGPDAGMFHIDTLDPHNNTKITVRYTAGYSTAWLDQYMQYNPYPDPLGITSRVMTMPTGKYTQLVIGNATFTADPPDHIFIEYRRYSSDEWTLYAQTEIDPLLPDFTYYGDGTDSEYVTPGYYRARYAWMPAPEDPQDPTYSGYVYTGQIGPSFAPHLTYPDITMPEAPEAIQVDATVNPLPHIWSSTMGATLSVMVIAVLGTAVAAYFVYGRS